MPDYQQILEDNPKLAESMKLRWTDYIPHKPTPKGRAFLSLPHREAFYGGAAGGGKSEVLAMGALQYVDIPNFAALIVRRSLADLELPGALMDRMHGWLGGSDARFKDMSWHFPSGARIQFGYLSKKTDRHRYQSSEYQYIAFDELTQFPEEDFLYLFSRLRRTRCPFHAGRVVDSVAAPLPMDPHCDSCQEYSLLGQVPLRIRTASNPGGIGHAWVRSRYQIKRTNLIQHGRRIYMGRHPDRPHIPAFVEDNPYLDREEYTQSLENLDPVTRAQLLAGDWGVSADGRFKLSWMRYFARSADSLHLKGQPFRSVPLHDCMRFMMVDPAASSKEGPADISSARDKRSWWAIGCFLITPHGDLLIWDVQRTRGEFPEVYQLLKRTYANFRPSFMGMELTGISDNIYTLMVNAGFNMRPFKPAGRDKVARSVAIANRMEQGKVFLPEHPTDWTEELCDELFTWTGHPDETDDQVDMLAYAGIYATQEHMFGPFEDRVSSDMLNELIPEAI